VYTHKYGLWVVGIGACVYAEAMLCYLATSYNGSNTSTCIISEYM
jgi:hypothetical protein